MTNWKIIGEVSTFLLEKLRNELTEDKKLKRDQIAFSAPFANNNDALLCIYLYSICKMETVFEPERLLVNGKIVSEMKDVRPLPISLRYVIYFDEKLQSGLEVITQHSIFGKLLYTLNITPTVEVTQDEPAYITILPIDDALKHHIWTGFSSPLRPCVFIEVSPLFISGSYITTGMVTDFKASVRDKNE